MKNQTKSTKLDYYRIKVFQAKVLGIKVNFISKAMVLKEVEKLVKYNKQGQISTPNPEHIVIAQNDYRMREIINNSWLATADGIGLVWAVRLFLRPSKLTKIKKLHRLSGIDLMVALCRLAAAKKWRVFLLGGDDGVAKKAAEALRRHSGTNPPNGGGVIESQKDPIALLQDDHIDYYSGSQNIQNETPAKRREAIKRINKFKPHLLFVAFGAPMQEKWIAQNLTKLKVNVAMGVGGAFDYLAGRVKRAPKWMRDWGLEWLWRLLKQPWRWKRQMRLIKFGFLVLKEKLS